MSTRPNSGKLSELSAPKQCRSSWRSPRLCRPFRSFRSSKVIFLLVLCAALFPSVASGQAKEIRRVLILNELGLYWPAINSMNQEIFAALRSSPYQIEFYSENLDTTLFSDLASQREFRDWYYHKYRDRKPDVIFAIGPAPIDLAAESHQVFSDTPVVFWGLSESGLTPALGPRFTGIWAVPEPEKTLDAALQLLPGTRHVVVTGGSSPFDREVIALFRERFRPYESRLDFTYLTDLTMPDLLERLKHLPSDTIVVHGAVLQDATGTRFINADVVPMEASVANAPVFHRGRSVTWEGACGWRRPELRPYRPRACPHGFANSQR